ncbi:ribonuclease H-like domain-containing protein [Tanacetum coccineum]
MSQPANDEFSQHLSDDEESNHEDASDTGVAPKQQQQVIPQTTAISNIKLPILKKEEYDIWAMEMEHYLEYIDNDVWKVIQNGNSKKRISTRKDGIVRILSPVTAAEIQAVEKERKAKNILLMAIPKEHMRRFHGMDDAKEIWEAIRTRFGGNANSKKMQKAVFKQQFEAFKISSSEGLEKGYDRFQQLLSQLEAHGAEVSNEDANHKFLKSLPPEWSNLAMTMRTKPDVDTLSIDDIKSSTNKVKFGFTDAYSTCTPFTSSTNILEKEALAGFANEVIYSLFAKQSEDWDLLHEDLEQIDDLDIEEMDINWQIAMITIRMKKFYKKTGRRVCVDGKAHVGFDKKKLECFNCHNTGHFARECTSKGTHDGKKKRDSFYQHQEAGKQEKNQMGLLTMDDGIVNWGEHTEDEETNHALMAISSSSEVSLCSKTCIDSYNTLKTLCDEQMNQLGDQEAQILAYSQAVKKLEAQLVTFQKQQLSLNEKLTFQANEIYEKDEKLKKYRRIGMKAVKEKEQLQKTLDSWKDSSKNLWRLINSGMSSNSKVGLGYEIQSNNEVLSYEEEMNFSVFNCSKEDSVGKPLYSRFIKTNDFKGVPHPLSGDYTPTPQEEIDESLYVYGKKGPQEPEPNVSDDRSSEYSTCQSNDSAGSIGTSSEHSVDPESEISSVPPEVYVSTPITTNEKGVSDPKSKEVEPSCVSHIKTPRQPIKDQATPKVNRKNWNAMMERELGEGYSFTKKKCFVCGSLSHLIKDCDYYEKKMAREAEFKKQRVFNTGNGVAKPVWTNITERIFLLINCSIDQPKVNTVNSNVNTVRSREPDHPLKNMVDRVIFDSGCSGHMTGNKDQLEDFEEFNGGSITFGGSKGYITGIGKIRHKVLFTKTECLVVSSDFKMPDENQILLKVPRHHNMYSFDMKTPSLIKGFACLIAKATFDKFRMWHMRSDNGTEFKNRDMLEFYGNKGIKQEYSNARTPQQNGVAERMNMTLIEAPRTMLANSLLPTTFWAKTVSTACYIFNRVRVTKPQNKTPYELLFGHKPIISYIRPFGCHVTILDTFSVLGKFDGKSDEGFLVGYSLNNKAYRVYNLVTKRVEVNLHVNFLKDKPNVKGVGFRWMFNIDYLTDSMNYIPVSLENQANPHAGASEVTNSASTSQTPYSNAPEEKDKDVEHIVVPSAVKNTEEKVESRTSSTNSKKEEILTEPQQKRRGLFMTISRSSLVLAFRRELEEIALKHLGTVSENNSTSTPLVNSGSEPVNSGRLDPDDSPMPKLKIFHKSETGIFDEASYDEEGVITDFNSLPTKIEVSPTPALRIHNIHPKSQILGDPKSAVQTRSKVTKIKCFMRILLLFKMQQRNQSQSSTSLLVGLFLSSGGTKKISEDLQDNSVRFKDARGVVQFSCKGMGSCRSLTSRNEDNTGEVEGVYVSQPPGFVDPDHPKKVYKVVKALYGLHQAPRAWYATLSTFLEKYGYKRGTIDKTINKVKQNTEGIFISQDKYVAEILKKFDLVSVKTAITTMETKVALTKDKEDVDVDVHLYRFMIGSLMYLTASRPDIMFAVCACKVSVTSQDFHLIAVSESLMDYDGSILDRKSTQVVVKFLGQSLISGYAETNHSGYSTTEAEYVVCNLLWTSYCGFKINCWTMAYFMNTKITIDNESTICIVKNPVYHSKTKHIEIRHHFIRDCYEKKLISVEKIYTDLNVADQLTKPFDGPRFNYLVIADLEKQLKETKQTFRTTILTLVERVKSLEVALKRKTKRVLLSDSEEEETEAQGRKTHDLDPLVSLVQELVTPSKRLLLPQRLPQRLSMLQWRNNLDVNNGSVLVTTDSIKVSELIKYRGRRKRRLLSTEEERLKLLKS